MNSAIDKVVSALTTAAASITKQSESEVSDWAKQFGPSVAQWGLELAAAKAKGDQAAIDRLTEDFTELAYLAIEQGSDTAVKLQSAGESAAISMLQTAAAFAPLLA